MLEAKQFDIYFNASKNKLPSSYSTNQSDVSIFLISAGLSITINHLNEEHLSIEIHQENVIKFKNLYTQLLTMVHLKEKTNGWRWRLETTVCGPWF